MSNLCNDSSDCDNDGIIRFCYEEASFSDEVFFCDCSNWYGWTGKECDIKSIQTTYFIISHILFSTIFLFVLILSCRTIYILSVHMKSNKTTRRKLRAIFITT